MTPEFPCAPPRAPRAAASATSPSSCESSARIAVTAASNVASRFDPVSESATG